MVEEPIEAPDRSDDSALLQEIEEEMRRVSVSDYIIYVLQSLSALALRRLGLSDATKGDKDLEQSRLAIDSFDALLQVVGPTRRAEEMQVHRDVLSQLRMAWVACSSGPASSARVEEPAAGPRNEEPAAGPDEGDAAAAEGTVADTGATSEEDATP